MLKTQEFRTARPNALKSLYRDIWRQLKGQQHLFVCAVLLLIAAQLVLLSVPYLSGRALNALQLHGIQGFREAGLWLATVLAVATFGWVLHGPARVLERRGALTIRARMSAALINRLFRLPLSWHEAHHSGATAHRVQQSTQALANFTQSQHIYLNSAVRLIGPLIALFWIEPILGAVAIGGFSLIVFSVVGFDRAMLKLARAENDAERAYSATLIDTLGNTNTVYALRQTRTVAARLEKRLLAVFVPLRRAIVLNEIKWVTVDLSTRVLNCCLVGLYVWLATRARPTGADTPILLGSLYMVWEYSQQTAGVVASIASNFQTFARQYADYASADLILENTPRELPVSKKAPAAWKQMTVRDLTFHHISKQSKQGTATEHGAGTPALERISLRLERGKRYALIGASGSGKSTLMRVLAGLYAADRISLTLDEGPTHIIPAEAAHLLRNTTTLIPQDAEVYEGTLGDNLGLCESTQGPLTRLAYPDALAAACATDFVESTEQGINAPVTERAANWSGGQRSRIALARGVLAASGSHIVLLDEPTASLDPATEGRVYANLFTTFSDACVISSVHRTSILGLFDEVLVMQAGRLVAQGTPDDLVLTSPEFARLTSLTSDTRPERHGQVHAVNASINSP